MEIRLDAHEVELCVFKRTTSNAKIAAEHNSHGDVVIDAVYQQELDIRDAECRELRNTTKEFYKTLYEKEQVIYRENPWENRDRSTRGMRRDASRCAARYSAVPRVGY
jgi:hypothetical protein